ncbi:MAG: hypothetical protein ACPGTU_14530, partial [Myxococcota bacterium]
QTQSLVADYIDFVASRLPRVHSVSMSAVQPHGRARDRHDLLPDYDILATEIRRARTRAKIHGIQLLNPYCGLPLCIGWEDGLDVSVEAIEASMDNTTQGIDNQGNKEHGQPCTECALRSQCGGAWHSYWTARGGAGIHPPSRKSPPWLGEKHPHQHIEDAKGRPLGPHLDRLSSASEPTRWLWIDGESLTDLASIRRAGVTDLAVRLNLVDLPAVKGPLAMVRKLIRSNQIASPQKRIQVHLEWPTDHEEWTAQKIEDAINIAVAIGVHSFTVSGPDAEQHAERLAMKHRAIPCRVLPSA